MSDHAVSVGPAEAERWWSAAVQMLDEGVSIREIARRYATDPRRIRRALARTGVRAHGVDLDGGGLPDLEAHRDQLGRQPDGVVARGAGVTPEAVSGERRRLDIAPFEQRRAERAAPAAPTLTVDEEEWIRGPVKEKRERQRINADALTVVRRPTRSDSLSPSMMGRPLLKPAYTPGEARTPLRTPTPPSPAPSGAFTGGEPPSRERRGREFFWDDRKSEINALLEAPRHQRDGRQRIVRADLPRLPPIESEDRPARVRSDAPAWRVVAPTKPDVALPVRPAATQDVLPPQRPAVRPMAVPVAAPPVVAGPPVVAEPPVLAGPRPMERWLVLMDGADSGLIVDASDVAAAATLVTTLLPEFMLGGVGLARVG